MKRGASPLAAMATCGAVSAHLVCVVVYAPQKERERGDALAAQILSTLNVRKR